MKTRTLKQALSIFLAVLMIALVLPFSLLTVFAEGFEYVEYDAAADGDLLYAVNFNATDKAFKFTDGASNWASTSATPSGDGSSVEVCHANNISAPRAKYYSMLTKYPVAGNSYTVQFTIDSTVPVGFLLDYYHGFVINPSTNTTSIGRSDDIDAIAAEQTYGGTFASKQTYAIEISCSSELGKTWDNYDGYTPTVYRLYVKDETVGAWKLIREIDETQGDEFGFEKGYSEYIFINLARYNANKDTKSTVSDVKIYKGIDIIEKSETESPTVPDEYIEYADANVGDVLYNVNFNATDEAFKFTDGVSGGWNKTGAVVSDEGRTVTIKNANNENKNRAKYYSELKKYPVAGNSYTVQFTIDSTVPVGFLLDYTNGFVINPSTNTTSIGRLDDIDAIAAEQTYGGTSASKQTYAIEISCSSELGKTYDNCDGYTPTVYRLYVKDETVGAWKLIREIDETQGNQFGFEKGYSEHIFINLARYNENKDTTSEVSDVRIYKGIDFLNVFYMADGAAVRMDDPTGLRFTGVVGKNYYDALKEQYGAENVKLGMLITPTDYLTDNGLEFTKEALVGCDAITGVEYLEIDAATVLTDGSYYKVNCAIVNILPENYDRAFSAILYVKITDGDTTTYNYSGYNEAYNSRSVASVAEAAYYDLKDAEDSTYKNEVTIEVAGESTTKYSRYTQAQRETLYAFFA